MKLFTMGDSISQGFMSGAAARTDLCYSTLVARKFKLTDYKYPIWGSGGLPVNIEDIMRALNRFKPSIRTVEWFKTAAIVNRIMNQCENYYERGAGALDVPYNPATQYFHNVSVRGFDVADAWLMNSQMSKSNIVTASGNNDARLFPMPNAAFYRTARKVLNPTLDPNFETFNALKWLQHHAETEGVENVFVWLGANNCLGTVLDLKLHKTPGDKSPVTFSHEYRCANWNLWHPADFEIEYETLFNKLNQALENNKFKKWKVFMATIPLVTILPLAKGVGNSQVRGGRTYFDYYTYRPFDKFFALDSGRYLTMDDALTIDDWIGRYNETIKSIVARDPEHFFLVDVGQALTDMKYKTGYVFPDYFKNISPKVNTNYYTPSPEGKLVDGGLFSLDGVHPSAIGQGLIANEFLKVMQTAGVSEISLLDDTDWGNIFATDSLYQQPINVMQDVYGHDNLAMFLTNAMRSFSRMQNAEIKIEV